MSILTQDNYSVVLIKTLFFLQEYGTCTSKKVSAEQGKKSIFHNVKVLKPSNFLTNSL